LLGLVDFDIYVQMRCFFQAQFRNYIFSPCRIALDFSVVELTSNASIYDTIEEILCTVG
jgi:hypothetical protein